MGNLRLFPCGAYFSSDGYWWITGGDTGFVLLDSTEVYTPNGGAGAFTNYIDLPEVFSHHILVAVDATRAILAGGYRHTSDVYMFDR